MPTTEQLNTIRHLNDAARSNPGRTAIANVTMGFHALADVDRFAALRAITRFSRFDEDNDPYGEHDFGAVYRLASGAWTQDRPEDELTITQTVFWKVDCYDNDLMFGSEAPWDESRTRRVLTIMLASEY